MNSTILYITMIGGGLLMAVLPFGVFMGLGSVLGIPAGDSRIMMSYIALALFISYTLSLGSSAIVQKSNCGEVTDIKKVALTSLFTTGFHVLLLGLAVGFPWFWNVVGSLLPPDTPLELSSAVVMAYYSFWATLFGIAIGGSMSGACGDKKQS